MAKLEISRDECLRDVVRFKTREQWEAHGHATYLRAKKLGILKECLKAIGIEGRGGITKAECMASAARFVSRGQWARRDNRTYRKAHAEDWVEECCAHMGLPPGGETSWTKRACLLDAAGYNARHRWAHGSPSAYQVAKTEGWVEECVAQMPANI